MNEINKKSIEDFFVECIRGQAVIDKINEKVLVEIMTSDGPEYEPKWWLDMMEIKGKMRNFADKYRPIVG